MASTPHVTPEQLSAADRAQVLRFVNEVDSAEAIATRVEIPGELDIGVRLGARILAHRAQLGGRFSTVQQLLEVRLIGPERFSELVSGILGWTRPMAADEDVRVELARLRLELRGLGGGGQGPRLTIEPVLARPFIGQPAAFSIAAFDPAKGEPLSGVSVLVQTDWGALATYRDFAADSGSSVEVQTDIEGRATVVLSAPEAATLRVEESAALESALELLDPSARIPEHDRKGFARLLERYRQPRNASLRAAVDAFFLAAQTRLDAVLAFDNARHAWPDQRATLRVSVLGAGGQITAEALYCARFKDWVGAFYRALLDTAREEPALRVAFDEALKIGKNESLLAAATDARLRAHFAGLQGAAAQAAGRVAAGTVVKEFLVDVTPQLPPATQKSLFALLPASSANLSTAGAAVFEALSEKHVEIRREIGRDSKTLGELGANLAELAPRFEEFSQRYNELNGKLTKIQIDIDDLRVVRGELERDMAMFNADFQRFQESYRGFEQQAKTLGDRVTAVDTRIQVLEVGGIRGGG